jgi:hypothetical protein
LHPAASESLDSASFSLLPKFLSAAVTALIEFTPAGADLTDSIPQSDAPRDVICQ